MKKNGTSRSPARARSGGLRAPLRNEGGFLLVIAMIIMLVVSTLAAANLINAMLERSLAKNQNYASLALQAAEAGIADGLTWLNTNGALLPSASPWADTADWPREYSANPMINRAITRDLSRDLNGDGDIDDPGEKLGSYRVTMRFKREWFDYNGDGDCTDPGESSAYSDGCDVNGDGDCADAGEVAVQIPDNGDHDAGTTCLSADPSVNALFQGASDIVLFNNGPTDRKGGYGFPDSRYTAPNGGFPVVEIDSTGLYLNAGVREVVLDVARNMLNSRGVKGGVTARGSVHLQGTPDVYGNNYNEAGSALDPSCPDLPGAYVETGQTATTGGSAAFHGSPPTVVNPGVGLPGHEDLVSTPWDALGILESEMPAPVTAATADAMLLDPNQIGQIVYVNATYSPPANAKGLLVIHNPAGTAAFNMTGNNKFTGLIVADVVILHGTADIIGAVVSLSTTLVDASHGTPSIKYSCSAINTVTRQTFSTRVGWHRIR